MTRRRTRAALLACLTLGLAGAAPSGPLAYLKGGAVWRAPALGAPPQQLPGSDGARRLAASPLNGTLAFTTDSADGRPFLSRPPFTASVALDRLLPGIPATTGRVRWLAWPDGRTLLAGTDHGLVAWDLTRRRRFVPALDLLAQSVSNDGEVTATLGSVASMDEPGVLLYGPGARPGTEVFTLHQPQSLVRALKAQPQPTVRAFLRELDPRAQADPANWAVTAPQVTPDGRQLFFASNLGTGLGQAGTTRSLVFQVDVASVQVRALGWLGPLSGEVQAVLPSPDGRRLLILLARQTRGETDTLLIAADLARHRVRELAGAPAGTHSVVDSVCWLADGLHVALSVAHPSSASPADADLNPAAFTLLVRDAGSGAVVRRVPGATSVSCGPPR